MNDSPRETASKPGVDLWTGLRIHLTLWILVAAVATLASRGVLLPGFGLGVPLVLALLLAVAVSLWVGRWSRGLRLTLHTISMGLALWALAELLLTRQASDVVSLERYPYPYRTHGVIPGLDAATNRLELTSNDTGLRDPDPIGPKPSGELRILVMGGSAVLGVGDGDQETIPFFVEERLRGAFPTGSLDGITRLRVINGGQPWYNSTQELVFFVTELALYEPDLVVVLDGYNDAYHTMVWGNRPPANQVTSEIISELLKSGRTYRDVTWQDGVRTLLNASNVRRRLGLRTRTVWGQVGEEIPVPEMKSNTPGEEMRLTMQHRLVMNWTLWDRLGDELGFRTLFALQPAIYHKAELSADEQAWLDSDGHRGTMAGVWDQLEAFVTAESSRLGLARFEADRYLVAAADHVFLDSCHLNATGNDLVARAVVDRVSQELSGWPWRGQWDGIRYRPDRGDPVWRPLAPTHQRAWNRPETDH